MNPEILPVLDEISAVLKKHDMTGLIIVGNKTHCDWRMEIAASWSCAWLENGKLRIRCKRENYPSTEAQKLALEQTVGTFVTFQHSIAKLNEQLDAVLVMVAQNGINLLGKSTDES